MHKTLVILAAGIGSRFGGGIKQLEPVDEYGHIIMDYSIHDAIKAGFTKIIFIIRHDIETDFKSAIGNRIKKVCSTIGVEVNYAYQDVAEIPDLTVKKIFKNRIKPWGTGHAVLACKNLIDSPFAVINADDYYGKYGFIAASQFLSSHPCEYGMVGYKLKNTLSDNGGVTRGICSVENGKLVGIEETKNIIKTFEGATTNGNSVNIESLVSMNFWCFPLSFIKILETGFSYFLNSMNDSMNDEYLLPVIADEMLKCGKKFYVVPTDDKWYGITYKEDKPAVVEGFRRLIENGEYLENLYSDLIDSESEGVS